MGSIGGVLEGVGLGDVVGYLGVDVEAGEGGGEVFSGFEGRGADVDGLVEDVGLETGGGGEEEAGLGGGAGAQFGDGEGVGGAEDLGRGGAGGEELAEDVVGVGGKESALDAGEVVLGEGGDGLKELGAALVVEEPGGEGLLGPGGEAGEGFAQYGLVEGDRGRGGQREPRGRTRIWCGRAGGPG